MQNSLLFTIIILNWNNYQETEEAIESCLKLTYKNKKIIVLDNASSDGSARKLFDKFPSLIHIQTGDNLGYAGGNNYGINKAMDLKSDFIMVLNNDTLIQNSDFIENSISVFQLSDDIGIIGPVILDKETKKRIDKHQNSFFEKVLESEIDSIKYNINGDKYKNVNRICGCGIIFSKKSLELCKGFDESFFMYTEEQDLCYRVKKANKFILKIEDKQIAVILRKNENKKSKPYIWYYITRNYFYLIKKHHSGFKKYFLYGLSFISALKKIFFLGDNKSRLAILDAFKDFIKNFKGKKHE